MIDSQTLDVILRVTKVLDELNVAYVIGGSVASSIHGQVRTTMDVDMVADLLSEHIPALIAGLSDDFYVPDQESLQQVVQLRTSFNLIHLASMFKVDIFLPQKRAFEQQQLSRRVVEPTENSSDERVYILSPEDVILAKLDWYRAGGEVSERQWRDILGVMKAQQTRLDLDYLRASAEDLNVADLLDTALATVKPLKGSD
jgi:hypothetical protein